MIYKEKHMEIFNLSSITSPLDQFEIRDLLSLDAPILGNLHLSITNIGLFLTIGTIFILGLNTLATNNNKIISNN
jgi:F-type H+-transporting ATPase subunit a